MNLILLFEGDFIEDSLVRLMDRRLTHLKKILKVQKGDQVQVGMFRGPLGAGDVIEVNENEIILKVNLFRPPPRKLEVSLIVALPRPKALPRIIFSATNLGVKKLAFVNFYKVEKSYWKSHYLNKEKVHESVCLGLEQAVDTEPPEINFYRRLKPFVEDDLGHWCPPDSERWICHPFNHQELSTAKLQPMMNTNSMSKNSIFGKSLEDPSLNDRSTEIKSTHKILVIGPDGGFIDYEVQLFSQKGFKRLPFFERILRQEIAIPALVSSQLSPHYLA